MFIWWGNWTWSLISATILRKRGLIVCQRGLRNSAGNPSGPCSLFLGICVRAMRSSGRDNGPSEMSAWSVNNWGCCRLSRNDWTVVGLVLFSGEYSLLQKVTRLSSFVDWGFKGCRCCYEGFISIALKLICQIYYFVQSSQMFQQHIFSNAHT